jgi:hypothetical protein
LAWSSTEPPGQEPRARIGYVGNMLDLDIASITLDYRVDDQPMRYPVGLAWTVPRIVCPLARNDGGPPRRVANLHLPPGGRYFGSREAYGLTYRSTQECGAHRGLFKRLAAQMGATRPLSVGRFGPTGTSEAGSPPRADGGAGRRRASISSSLRL